MIYFLTKLSKPGWDKTFDTEEEARNELYTHICKPCILAEELTLDSTIDELLATDCGREYIFDKEY